MKQYRNIPEVVLIGASDIDPSRAPEGISFFKDYRELLDNVDAVSITTPTSTHFEIASAAISAGKHSLIEKPIALNFTQGKKLIKLAKSKNRVLSIGHIERFNPAYRSLVKHLGRTQLDVIDIKRLSPFPERITDASCVTDMMIHDIDLAIKLSGSEVKGINATGKIIRSNKLDKALAIIVFKNGIVANIEASRVHNEKVRRITVTAGKDTYEADLLNKKARKTSGARSSEIKVEMNDQLKLELKDFIYAVIKGKKPSVTGEDGLEALNIANKIEELALKQC